MKKFNIFKFPCGNPNEDMRAVGNGMRNAAYQYAVHENFKEGNFYLFVDKEYGGILSIKNNEDHEFWKSSILMLVVGNEIIDMKAQYNKKVSKEDEEIIFSYIKELYPDIDLNIEPRSWERMYNK